MYFSQWSDGNVHHGIEPELFSTFSSSFSSGHQSPKPDMISQLEREEKFCTIEIQPPEGVQVSTAGPGQHPALRAPVSSPRAAREASWKRAGTHSPALQPPPPLPSPHSTRNTGRRKRWAGWPSRAVLHTPPVSTPLPRPLFSHPRFMFLTSRTLSLGQKAASPQTSQPPSSAEKLSHPRPSLATPFNSWVVFLAALCSMGSWFLTRDGT